VHSSEALLTVREKPQKGIKVKGAKMLAADVPTEEDILGIKAHRTRIEGK
jgi:aromatic ring hydroxylase